MEPLKRHRSKKKSFYFFFFSRYYLVCTRYYLVSKSCYLFFFSKVFFITSYYLVRTSYYLVCTRYYLVSKSCYLFFFQKFFSLLVTIWCTPYYLVITNCYLVCTRYYLLSKSCYLFFSKVFSLLVTIWCALVTIWCTPYYLVITNCYLVCTSYYLVCTSYYLVRTSYYLCLNDFQLFCPVQSPDTHLYFSSVRTVYTVGYALSLISLSIAIAILCLFRKLHCTRNYIHIQLFLSFILKAIFIFARDTLLFSESTYHCNSYPVACKFVPIFSNYCILANYSWLLVEGHFLFTLVSRSFFSLKKHLIWYIVLSWGLSLIVIVTWSCAKYFYEDEGCWETGSHEWILWILRVPVLLTICMNLIFFLGILRVLVSKLRMPDFFLVRKLIKSTFFLVAVFGLHYIVFVFLRVEASSYVSKIKMFAELVLSSTQGLMVATLYCFMNGEVRAANAPGVHVTASLAKNPGRSVDTEE
uniref:G-protein coupled receptors family 2 profile 2 domain-containing protein n=1 Tax=Oryzias melastigma TaxID=30732 RepID=A0A3B3BFL4_ORYME